MIGFDERPFFIVGSGRSGTTLLRMVLSGHSRISIPPETWFLLDLVSELPLHDELSSIQVDRAVELITNHYRWPDLNIDAEQLRAAASESETPTIRSIADIVYHTVAKREGGPRWGDKTPAYVEIVPQLAEIYPSAQFIHLVRDGRDVARSFHEQGWSGRWLVWSARQWCAVIDSMQRHRASLGPERLFEVRYEDLVLDTERVARRLCAFLGEQYEPAMLTWESSVRDKVPDREIKIHTKLFRKPRPEDVGRWRRELSAVRTFALESVIGARLASEGYELRFGGAGWKPALGVCRVACMAGLPVLESVLRSAGAFKRRLLGGKADAARS